MQEISKLFSDLEDTLKLGWLITGCDSVAGSRLHGWAMHDFLSLQGLYSHVVWSAPAYKQNLTFSQEETDALFDVDVNVLVLQGVRSISDEDYFFKQCDRFGVKTVFVDADNINLELASRCDAIICVNDYSKSLFPLDVQEKVFVAIDHFEHDGSKTKTSTDKKELKLCFLSNNVYNSFPGLQSLPENTSLKIIGPPKKRVKKFTPHKKLFTETTFPFDYVLWNLDTVEDELLDCDVGLIPYPKSIVDAEYIKRKSNNRLVLFMSYGIPCVVSPIGEYKKIIRHGENGFLATSSEEWEKYVTLLRDDPALRKKMGEAARADVIEKYSLLVQANQYLSVINTVLKK